MRGLRARNCGSGAGEGRERERGARLWMGCCQSQHKGKGIDRRNVIDHFMPPGAPQQPRFTYRLEKVRHRPGRVREGQSPSPD